MTQEQIGQLVQRVLDSGDRYFVIGKARYEVVRNDKKGWHIRTMRPGEKREDEPTL